MRELPAHDIDWTNDSDLPLEAASLLDRHSDFEGTFRSQRDVRVEGNLKGNVTCDGTLFIAEGASVAATVDAEHISVAGDLTGEIRCRGRLHILPSGRVRAKVTTGSLVVQEGAIYEGQLEMAGLERPAPRALRQRQPASVVGIDSNSGERTAGNGTTFIRRLGSPETPWTSVGNAEDLDEGEETDSQGPAS
jgi:cytoskeletal protein CcmA (bactofilin family)